MSGQFGPELYGDAIQFEEAYQSGVQNETPWRDWPLLSTDGDTAAVLQMFSDFLASHLFTCAYFRDIRLIYTWTAQITARFDTSNARKCRVTLDMNSKKASTYVYCSLMIFSDIPYMHPLNLKMTMT